MAVGRGVVGEGGSVAVPRGHKIMAASQSLGTAGSLKSLPEGVAAVAPTTASPLLSLSPSGVVGPVGRARFRDRPTWFTPP